MHPFAVRGVVLFFFLTFFLIVIIIIVTVLAAWWQWWLMWWWRLRFITLIVRPPSRQVTLRPKHVDTRCDHGASIGKQHYFRTFVTSELLENWDLP